MSWRRRRSVPKIGRRWRSVSWMSITRMMMRSVSMMTVMTVTWRRSVTRRSSVNFLIFRSVWISCEINIGCLCVVRQPKIQRAANSYYNRALKKAFHRVHFPYIKIFQANSLIKKSANKPPTISWGTSRATPISANISGMSFPSLNVFR